MKCAVAAILCVAISGAVMLPSSAEAADTAAYISFAGPLAQKEYAVYGVPASVAIAQSILESGWGGSGLTKEANNYFGIKCPSSGNPANAGSSYVTSCVAKDSYEYPGPVLIRSYFRGYSSAQNSFLDHGLLLSSKSWYRPAFAYSKDPNQFIREIAKGGYATDPSYADLVISIMRQYNLYRFDAAPVTPSAPTSPPPATVTQRPAVTATPTPTPTVTPAPTVTPTPTVTVTPAPVTSSSARATITPTPTPPPPASTSAAPQAIVTSTPPPSLTVPAAPVSEIVTSEPTTVAPADRPSVTPTQPSASATIKPTPVVSATPSPTRPATARPATTSQRPVASTTAPRPPARSTVASANSVVPVPSVEPPLVGAVAAAPLAGPELTAAESRVISRIVHGGADLPAAPKSRWVAWLY